MNTMVKQTLNLTQNVNWTFVNDYIHTALRGDFLIPVTDKSKCILQKEYVVSTTFTCIEKMFE